MNQNYTRLRMFDLKLNKHLFVITKPPYTYNNLQVVCLIL